MFKKKVLSRHILTNWQIIIEWTLKTEIKFVKFLLKGREELKVDKHIEILN